MKKNKKTKTELQLSSEDLLAVKKILGTGFEAIAFGSRSTGQAQTFSDLDLCIVNNPPPSYAELSLLKEAFEESDLSFQVDVSIFEDLPEDFRKIILADGIRI